MLACDLRIHSGKASSKVPFYAYTLWIHKDRRFEPVKAALMKVLMTFFEVLAHQTLCELLVLRVQISTPAPSYPHTQIT
jgi:hypothetical protein